MCILNDNAKCNDLSTDSRSVYNKILNTTVSYIKIYINLNRQN